MYNIYEIQQRSIELPDGKIGIKTILPEPHNHNEAFIHTEFIDINEKIIWFFDVSSIADDQENPQNFGQWLGWKGEIIEEKENPDKKWEKEIIFKINNNLLTPDFISQIPFIIKKKRSFHHLRTQQVERFLRSASRDLKNYFLGLFFVHKIPRDYRELHKQVEILREKIPNYNIKGYPNGIMIQFLKFAMPEKYIHNYGYFFSIEYKVSMLWEPQGNFYSQYY